MSAPGQRTDVTITSHGDGELTVGWSAPFNDGASPVIGYRVPWDSGGQSIGDDSSRERAVPALGLHRLLGHELRPGAQCLPTFVRLTLAVAVARLVGSVAVALSSPRA